jgi:hypothetical protein
LYSKEKSKSVETTDRFMYISVGLTPSVFFVCEVFLLLHT